MRRSKNALFCFSPPVMVATFLIEITLALYALYRYQLNVVGRLIVSALFFLGLFQLAEYFVCGGAGLSSAQWSRIGYAAITTLPPIGLHMMYAINGTKLTRVSQAAYGTMAAFIAYFLLAPTAFSGYECMGNYVIFQLSETATMAYHAFYYGWLFTALAVGYTYIAKGRAEKQSDTARKSTIALMAGYGVFLVPTAIVNSIDPTTVAGIPSIMCGFAVFFALILALYILPRTNQPKDIAISWPKWIQ